MDKAADYYQKVRVSDLDGMARTFLVLLSELEDENHVVHASPREIARQTYLYVWATWDYLVLLQDYGIVTLRMKYDKAKKTGVLGQVVLHGPWDNFNGSGIPFLEHKGNFSNVPEWVLNLPRRE